MISFFLAIGCASAGQLGLPQSTLYELIAKGELVSFGLQLKKGRKRGVRFVHRVSIDQYLDRKACESGVNPEALESAKAK
jgi:predicted DNA-binding transcriptional regulator AlpA